MKILLFGKNGQLGWELQRSLAPLGEVIALGSDNCSLCGNFLDLDGIARTIRTVRPDVIVNAAAYTAVDKAESEADLARAVNALAPATLAVEAKRSDAWLIHYSTDYVFDGNGDKAWLETDSTNPLNTYGRTKLEGEEAISRSGCHYLIFRTSWVYAAKGSNFAKTMLRLGVQREDLTVIDDQIGAPTGADLIADVSAHAIRTVSQRSVTGGLYHLAANGETSWHKYANYVLEFARQAGASIKVSPEAVNPVPSSAFHTPAQRPKNSRLNTTKLQKEFGLRLPHWTDGVARMLTEILEK